MSDPTHLDPNMLPESDRANFMESDEDRGKKPKTVADLPEEEQSQYVDLPNGGFVRRSALEAWETWEKLAEQANNERGFVFKVLNIGKSTAMGLAHEEALVENEKIPIARENAKILTDSMVSVYKHHIDLMRDYIDQHKFDAVISEDRKGRFPAELMQMVINKIYEERDEQQLPLIPLRPTRHDYYTERGEKELARWQAHQNEMVSTILNAIESGKIKNGMLYVTDVIDTGRTIQDAVNAISEAIKTAVYKKIVDKNIMFCIAAVSGQEGLLNRRIKVQHLDKLKNGEQQYSYERDFMKEKEYIISPNRGNGNPMKVKYIPGMQIGPAFQGSFTRAFSGIDNDSAATEIARREALEKTSDEIVEFYNNPPRVDAPDRWRKQGIFVPRDENSIEIS